MLIAHSLPHTATGRNGLTICGPHSGPAPSHFSGMSEFPSRRDDTRGSTATGEGAYARSDVPVDLLEGGPARAHHHRDSV
jgi:hypothetical protein